MLRLVAFVVIALCLLPSKASAQSCTFSVSDVVFSNVDTLAGRAVDATGEVQVTCVSGLITNVRACLNINAGSGGATSGARQMRHSGTNAPINFQLYQDPNRTVPWGSRTRPDLGEPMAVTFANILPGGTTRAIPIYARIFGAQQSARAGFYSSVFSGAEIEFNWDRYLLVPSSCATISQNRRSVPLNVRADVPNNCIVSTQDINFGSHGILRDAVEATGGIDVTCTVGTAYNVGLGDGLHGDGPTQRRMALGDWNVTYGLYRDPARLQPWGDTIGVNTQIGVGAGTAQQLSVYGRVPPQPTPGAGTYRDTVVVTVTY